MEEKGRKGKGGGVVPTGISSLAAPIDNKMPRYRRDHRAMRPIYIECPGKCM